MKKSFKIIIVLFLAIYAVCYWAGTQNFYLGSANYYKTAFEDEELNTKWHYGEIFANVQKDETTMYEKCMVVSCGENKYIFKARGVKLLDIYPYEEYLKLNTDAVTTFPVEYKKSRGKVYAFKIYGTDKESLFSKGKDNIIFYKIN